MSGLPEIYAAGVDRLLEAGHASIGGQVVTLPIKNTPLGDLEIIINGASSEQGTGRAGRLAPYHMAILRGGLPIAIVSPVSGMVFGEVTEDQILECLKEQPCDTR